MDNKEKELEFDPTESEDFYNNLEAAIGIGEKTDAVKTTEWSLPEHTFISDEPELPEDDPFDDEIFAGVNAALSAQIAQEFGEEPETSVTEEKTSRLAGVWKGLPVWTKVLSGIILAVLISIGLLFGTKGGRKLIYNIAVEWMFDDFEVEATPTPELDEVISPTPILEETPTPEPTTDPEETLEPTPEPDVTLTPTPSPKPVVKIMDDENVINVLLLGEENIYNASQGRTDAIILVSINLNGGPLKMVSFQRDLYVDVPGKSSGKLNAAYVKTKKLSGVVETIEKNFGVDIDGYAKVDFKGFEDLIDSLGGLRISLTAKESEYLNTTKYISKPSERNTVAGEQNMTGAQVLGYCRVRYVKTADGLSDDRGRNARHRIVLKALFNKFRGQNITQLNKLIEQCSGYVTVSGDLKELCKKGLFAVVENKMFEIETMQFPQSNMYENQRINGEEVVVHFPGSVEKLQEFIFGK